MAFNSRQIGLVAGPLVFVLVRTAFHPQDLPPEANAILIGKEIADRAMDAAACIGCGACVATCKNSSAALFTSAKINHLNALPQGSPEAHRRVLDMAQQMEDEGFGHCSFTGACEIECPQEISISNIAEMNARVMKAKIFG